MADDENNANSKASPDATGAAPAKVAIVSPPVPGPVKKKRDLTAVETSYGKVRIYIQGDLEQKDKRAVFLTVHDIGTNHSSFVDFIDQPCMAEIRSRSIFIHVDLPGQEDGAEDMGDAPFPSIQQMGEMLLPSVLDHLDVKLVVGLGEGAGANILVRFALAHPQRALGLILIHLVTSGVGMLEKLKDSFNSGRRRQSEAFLQPFDQVIALHKFGQSSGGNGSTSPSVEDRQAPLLQMDIARNRVASLNPKNLRKYVEAYMNRKDMSEKLAGVKTLDSLLVAGGRSPYCQGVVTLHGKMEKSRTSLLRVDNALDVMGETPEKLATSLLLFAQGLGYLTSLQRSSVSSDPNDPTCPTGKAVLGAIGRRRTLSMEEYDLPRPRRLSLTAEQAKLNQQQQQAEQKEPEAKCR